MNSLIASIPSPSSPAIELGPLTVRYYGLLIGLGVLAAVYIAGKRWNKDDPKRSIDDASYIAVWGVVGGFIGAKAYHVLTSIPEKGFVDFFLLWEPGLGIPGGLLVGFLAAWYASKRRGMNFERFMHAAIPGIPVAQAIGRVGNYFNQELFGRPTDLAWAIEIDQSVRENLALQAPEFGQFVDSETFHPTFAYEALLNLVLAGLLVLLDRMGLVKRRMMLPLYVAGYGAIRLVVETFRADEAAVLFGVRFNGLLAAVAIVVGLGLAIWAHKTAPKFVEEQATIDLVDEGKGQEPKKKSGKAQAPRPKKAQASRSKKR